MEVQFLGQPFDVGGQVGRAITGLLTDRVITHFLGITAWAKVSGLNRVSSSIKDFGQRGGYSELIVGIDEGGATIEGLQLALELFSEVWIFHDPGVRTFHPKIYVASNSTKASVLVGSSNLTKGGLFTNYEASLKVDLDLQKEEPDRSFFESVTSYVKELKELTANCRLLDNNLLARICSDPRFRITSEKTPKRSGQEQRGQASSAGNLFGGPVRGLQPAPSLQSLPSSDSEHGEDQGDSDSILEPILSDPPPAPDNKQLRGPYLGATSASTHGTTPLRFWKALSANDVSLTSSPGQIIIPIRFKEFFEPLVLQIDNSTQGGVRQSHHIFPVVFIDGGRRVLLQETRAILYEPASDHPRQNVELRYTFRDRQLLETLQAGQILRFSRDANGAVTIELLPSSTYQGRYGWL